MNILHHRFLLPCIFVALTALPGAAQGFMRIYDQQGLQKIKNAITAVAPTSDGGFLIAYNYFIAKTDAEGLVLWKKPTSHQFMEMRNDIIQLPDGRFLLATCIDGSNTHNRLSFFEPDGDLLWENQYPKLMRVARSAQGFVLVDRTSQYDYSIAEIDLQGKLLWRKNYKSPTPFGFVCGIVVNQDQSLTIAASSTTLLLRLLTADSQGNVKSDSTYKNVSMGNFPGKIYPAKQGGYIFAEQNNISGNALTYISKTGGLGWSRYVSGIVSSSTQAANGDILVVRSESIYSNWLTRYDTLGRVVFDKNYVLPERQHDFSAANQTLEGGFVVVSGLASSQTGFMLRTNARGVAFSNLLTGRVASDRNRNCVVEPADRALANWLIYATRRADGRRFYSSTDDNGRYTMNLDTGRYAVTAVSPGQLWALCQPVRNVTFTTQKGDTTQADFSVKDSILCPLLEVGIGAGPLLHCKSNEYKIRWCNNGTQLAPAAQVLVVLPQGLSYNNSSIPVTQRTVDSLWFRIGDVDIAQCGQMSLNLYVRCDSVYIGQTKCVEAHIFPNKFCAPPPNWSGAQIVASAKCVGDTSVAFTLRNVGSGRTARALDYVITEDVVVLRKGSFDLLPGQSKILMHPANNKTLRIETKQEANFPFLSMPSAGVEGCGISPAGWAGILSQFPTDDGSPHIDIDCQVVQSDYKANLTVSQPTGYGERRFVTPEAAITYTTQFANLTTDTITTVILRDTLSPWLDPATLQIGAASHPFTWKLKDNGVLERRFENVQLPHRAANEAASGGFAQYAIQPRRDAPNGTVVSNRSALFFDSETPVRLPRVFHTIGREFYTVSVQPEPGENNQLTVSVFPNPFTEYAHIAIPGAEGRNFRFSLVDATGREVLTAPISQEVLIIHRTDIGTGMYFYQIVDASGRVVARGKIIMTND